MSQTEFNKPNQSFFNFFKALLAARWQSLLLLLIGIYLPLQIFGLLAIAVWESKGGFPFPWDVPILIAVHSTATAQLDAIAVVLTQFGSSKFMFPAIGFLGLLLLLLQRWRSLTFLLTTTIGSAIINRTAKEFMHRIRPHLWDSLAPELDFSFPSGHSMMTMTLVATLVVLTWGTLWSWAVLIAGSFFVIAIGWTRLYLGVHFPSDILAGWMVSIAWVIGVSLIIRPHFTKTTAVTEAPTAEETTLLPEEKQVLQEKTDR
ncbi:MULTISPECIES: phosphatase PAP2 family protein [Nostocales]|uniref:Membrane protein n=3 Tax=Nostocales TaxID=1161 RepID=A0A0C1N6B4_9CYAN|nr:phosphatase PAP2 family protein [Tolypothrix bouteillei]KAF3886138.1 phosphatase PAP2 family protein [Tolypothrix bouteillei VB521301]